MEFKHHEHSLSLRNVELIDQGIKCKVCMKSVVAPFYGCDSCEYYVHKSCGDLPLQFPHSFHPSHPLRLYTNFYFDCDSCFKYFEDSPSYVSEEGRFRMDVECAMMPTETPSKEKEGQRWMKHFSHPHPLLFAETCHEHSRCLACLSKVSGEAAYGCAHCGYWLHQSCADFQSQSLSQHPLHPHPLSPNTRYDYTYITCGICETTSYRRHNFHFKCAQCDFSLCRKCNISVRRSFMFDDYHHHALCFVENDSLHRCDGYDAYCTQSRFFNKSKEFECTKWSIFKCMDCNFKLHLLCGPLPSTVKHECHIHSLTLLDSLFDNNGEYYCDVCEEERDARIRVYYCEECKYSAHVHCVMSEIVKVQREYLEGVVELRALGNDTWSRAAEDQQPYTSTNLTLNDLLLRMAEHEKEELGWYYKWDSTLTEARQPLEEKEESIADEEIDKTLRLSRFTEDDFTTFCHDNERYYGQEKLELKSSELGLKLWEVEGYMIPHSLAAVLQTILKEHGRIECDLRERISPEMQSFVMFILCGVVKRMCGTMVKDITTHQLQQWYYHLRFLRNEGFEIGFACAQWERLVDAFLALQAERLESEIPAILDAKMAKIQQDLEKCNEYKESSERSEYMKYCFRKASELRWKRGFDCLIWDGCDGSQSIPREPYQWPRY